MSRETVRIADEARSLRTTLEVAPDDHGAMARLARLEEAYAQLLRRVRGYERERRVIKSRLERLLAMLPRP